jgi:hypothetical protein
VKVNDDAEVSEVHAASILRVEVGILLNIFVTIALCFRRMGRGR